MSQYFIIYLLFNEIVYSDIFFLIVLLGINNILIQNYNVNPFQFGNNSSINEEITFSDSYNRSLYFNNNNNNNNEYELNIRGRKDQFDYARRKLKTLVLNNAFEFIKGKLKYKYQLFQKIAYDVKKEKPINEEKIFINKTLGEIFSNKVSSKYTTIRDKDNFNKKKIDEIKESNNKLNDIFNITFIDCLNHFMGHKKSELLSGMTEFKDIILEDKIEKNNLLYYSKNYIQLLNKIKPRKPKKKNQF